MSRMEKMENTKLEEHVDEVEKVEDPGNFSDDHLTDSEPDTEEVSPEMVSAPEDYSTLTKSELIEKVKALSHEQDIRHADRVLRDIKPHYTHLRDNEREEALQKFLAEGGSEGDFDYRGDDYDRVFDEAIRWVNEQKASFHRQQEEERAENFKKKEELLETLRALLDSTDTTDQFNRFKEIQTQWKTIGPISGPLAKSLWANYHALVDRFYDNRSIYFELKELDRRKNLEAKLELCQRAEQLAQVEKISDAVKELNELHQEFKHLGPVPIEEKEALWQRFKAASDAVYARRDEYVTNLQQQLSANAGAKAALCAEAETLSTFSSDKIKEWNARTKEILELQKKWDAIGGLPRAKAKEINKRFWSAFKAFFSNKNTFFRQLDSEREKNLDLKLEMVKRANELKDSLDWDKTSAELRELQQKWREVGPVPERQRDKIFKEFKEACDYFFEKRRNERGKTADEQTDNLKGKEEVIRQMEEAIANGTGSEENLKKLSEQFEAIGFVPRKDIERIKSAWHTTMENYVQAIPGIDIESKARLMLEMELMGIRKDPRAEHKIFQKEQVVRKKISKVENDIALWRNNLEFFAKSANADTIRGEFNIKIREASAHLQQLKQQLRLLRAAG